MDAYVRRLQAVGSQAEAAQRALERAIVRLDDGWSDDARQSFDADHLAAIRLDARRAGGADEIARLSVSMVRALGDV